jgi:hypothetical protein
MPKRRERLVRSHRFVRSNFEPGRRFANPVDFQLQRDGWCDRVNRRVHHTILAVPAERLIEERERMRPLPDTHRRRVVSGDAAAVSPDRTQRLLVAPASPAVASSCASPRHT